MFESPRVDVFGSESAHARHVRERKAGDSGGEGWQQAETEGKHEIIGRGGGGGHSWDHEGSEFAMGSRAGGGSPLFLVLALRTQEHTESQCSHVDHNLSTTKMPSLGKRDFSED